CLLCTPYSHSPSLYSSPTRRSSDLNEAIYMYGASSTEHRAHGASFLLQFEAMRWARERGCSRYDLWGIPKVDPKSLRADDNSSRSEEHTSELQSRFELVCRLPLEKK